MSTELRRSGVIKWFNEVKGFGFIVPSDGAPDIFIHKNTLRNCGVSLCFEGMKVHFVSEPNAKDRQGRHVCKWIAAA